MNRSNVELCWCVCACVCVRDVSYRMSETHTRTHRKRLSTQKSAVYLLFRFDVPLLLTSFTCVNRRTPIEREQLIVDTISLYFFFFIQPCMKRLYINVLLYLWLTKRSW